MHSKAYINKLRGTLMTRLEEKVDEMIDLHVRKSAGYAGKDNLDPWENFRTSTLFGVEPWRGALVRAGDKWTRLTNIVQNPENDQIGEGIESEGMDLAAYMVIISVLYAEDPNLPENRVHEFRLGGAAAQAQQEIQDGPQQPFAEDDGYVTDAAYIDAPTPQPVTVGWTPEQYARRHVQPVARKTPVPQPVTADTFCMHDGEEDASDCPNQPKPHNNDYFARSHAATRPTFHPSAGREPTG